MLKNKDKLLGILAVDGAILADIEGRCHCVGAILDGEAVMKGDAGRGSRYNSLVNYVNWRLKKYQKEKGREKEAWCFAVVFSEDEMITITKPEIEAYGL